MSSTKRKMWHTPWRYRESIAITIGVLLVGFILQITIGNFDFYLLHFPANIIIAAILIAVIALLSFWKSSSFAKWLSSLPLAVSLLGGLMVMSIIMGLTPQLARIDPTLHLHCEHSSWWETLDYIFIKLGFRQVTSSWPFVLMYGFTLLSLGSVIARRLHNFKIRDYGFYLNHLGLWIFLFAAGLGSADLLRYVMYVEEGEVEWRVFDAHENMEELDIAIELHDFIMEEYAPKLAVINSYTGDVQPENRPRFYQIDQRKPAATLGRWDIQLEEYIHEAVRKTDTTFQHIPMPGSMPAARVRVIDRESGAVVSGWLTCGSVDQYIMPLEIDSIYALVMTKPEAKRFASDITVISKDKGMATERVTIEVNSPYTAGNWKIYQYDYDHALGKASRMSGFELVYDPWLRVVYLGIIMVALGSICMLWLGNKKNRKS